MMEVGSPSLSRARHIEQTRLPSVDTELSLGLPASDNTGVSILPQGTGLFSPMPVSLSDSAGGYRSTSTGRDETLPISSFGQDTIVETLPTLPLVYADGNQITSTSPSDNGLPPSIPTAAYWTTPTVPQNSIFIPTLPNVGAAKEFDRAVLRDAGSESVVIAHTSAPVLTEAMRVEDADCQLDMATHPSYLEKSQPSPTAVSNMHSDDKNQVVHDNQILEASDTQPAIVSVTQPDNGNESFDDVAVLQKDTFATTAPLLTNDSLSVLHDVLDGTDARPSQCSFDCPDSAHRNGIPSTSITNLLREKKETYLTAEELDWRLPSTIDPIVNESHEFPPAETAEQLDLREGKKERNTFTSEPQPGGLDENLKGRNNADGEKPPDGVAEIGIKDYVNENSKIVSEQDIQAIKGRKVAKKFGRKIFKGEVAGYDDENQWFKVVYEDGDDEDLTLLEVKEILLNEDISSNASTGERKRSQPEGAVNNQQARKQVATPKRKGSATKKAAQQESKTKGLERKAKSEGPVHSQSESGAERKTSCGAKLEVENVGEKQNSKKNKKSSGAKPPTRSVANQGGRKAMGSGRDDNLGNGKSKRQKVDSSMDRNTLVGKAVKKDFNGSLYSGVVTKFDKKTEYYKVEYEDGDQEDLELEELKAVLVP